jgi:hypothetical protein
MSDIGKLRVRLGLDNRAFKQGIADSNRNLRVFVRGIAVASIGIATAAGTALATLGARSLSAIDSQAKLAESLGTTTRSIQIMSRAGETAGVTMSGIEQAAKDLQRRLSQTALTGAGPAAEALQRLGLSAAELLAMPLDERITAINSAIEEFVPLAGQAAVAGALFGEEGSLAMLRIDPSMIVQATGDIERFGVAVSEVDSDQIERTNDALSRLSLIGEGLGNRVAVSIAPSLERMADFMARISEVGGPLYSTIDAIGKNLDRFAGYATAVAAVIGGQFVYGFVAARIQAISLTFALQGLKLAIASTGVGLLVVGLGELATRMIRVRGDTEKYEDGVYYAEGAQRSLNAALNSFRDTSAPAAGQQAINLAKNLVTEAEAAYEAALAQRELEAARLASISSFGEESLASNPAAPSIRAEADRAARLAEEALTGVRDAQARLKAIVTEVANSDFSGLPSTETPIVIERATVAMAGLRDTVSETEPEVADLAETLDGQLASSWAQMGEAFGDFIERGFKDFKSFAASIKSTFMAMLRDMIVAAAKNKIIMSMGLSGTSGVAGMASGLLGGGSGGGLMGIAGSIGTFASSIGTGLSVVGSGFMAGGLGGAATATMGAVSGGIAAGGVAGIGTAIGAALPVLGVAAVAIGLIGKLFGKKKPIISAADFKAIEVGLALTNQSLAQTGTAAKRAAANLKNLAGGAKDFTELTQGYFANFFTATEQRAEAIKNMGVVFDGLNLTMPTTAKDFRALVESLDLTTSKGREAYVELLKVSDAFAAVYGSVADTNAALSQFLDGNIFTSLVEEKLAAAAVNRGASVSFVQSAGGIMNPAELIRFTETGATPEDVTMRKLGELLRIVERWDAYGVPANAEA